MEYVYVGAIIGLCLLNLWAYRRGLKDGLALNQGKPIEPIQNPVKSFVEFREKATEKKEVKQANTAQLEGFANLMAYDGTDQTKVGEK